MSRPGDLIRCITPFISGQSQFQLETGSDTFRGEIDRCVVSYGLRPYERRIKVYLNWLVRLGIVFAPQERRVFKGFELPDSVGDRYKGLVLCYQSFYQQPNKGGRLKMTSNLGEIIRFFLPDDPTRLVRNRHGDLISSCTVDDYVKILPFPESFSQMLKR